MVGPASSEIHFCLGLDEKVINSMVIAPSYRKYVDEMRITVACRLNFDISVGTVGSVNHRTAADSISDEEMFESVYENLVEVIVSNQAEGFLVSCTILPDQMRGGNIESLAAIQQTRMLAHTLSQNSDPKFRNSKFVQFVSEMSRGELIIDDNQVKPASENWATEYQQQYNGGASWADEFAHDEASRDIVEARDILFQGIPARDFPAKDIPVLDSRDIRVLGLMV
ncbi:hypothetical protein GOBAR_AA34643 [Gossypium barbadense]|uniref:Uncharacterized protein n=1 Tax=Gossypium barbadense TaxID=3634 RepID=A0A2P5W4M4_GOSBA|nr:hypothetical protein GOBAR_AA34643 [Gossypium barbadense]